MTKSEFTVLFPSETSRRIRAFSREGEDAERLLSGVGVTFGTLQNVAKKQISLISGGLLAVFRVSSQTKGVHTWKVTSSTLKRRGKKLMGTV